jgi:hypothetical protein
MTTTIKVSVRSVYGRETIYPACPHSVFLCRLAKTRTITDDMMRLIQAQGYRVEVEAPSLTFARGN